MTILGQKRVDNSVCIKIENDFRHVNGSTCFRWPYRRDYDEGEKLWAEMEKWCEKNCRGKFESEDVGLCVYDDNEAMRFKLVFG